MLSDQLCESAVLLSLCLPLSLSFQSLSFLQHDDLTHIAVHHVHSSAVDLVELVRYLSILSIVCDYVGFGE